MEKRFNAFRAFLHFRFNAVSMNAEDCLTLNTE